MGYYDFSSKLSDCLDPLNFLITDHSSYYKKLVITWVHPVVFDPPQFHIAYIISL